MRALIICLFTLILFSCSKQNIKTRSNSGTVTMNIDGVPYSSTTSFHKSIILNSSGYTYIASLADQSPAIYIRIYNDSIYTGQVITLLNGFDNESNGLQFQATGIYGEVYYNDINFTMCVNSVNNNEASGTFSGNLLASFPASPDTMIISNGVFTNIPVQ